MKFPPNKHWKTSPAIKTLTKLPIYQFTSKFAKKLEMCGGLVLVERLNFKTVLTVVGGEEA
jgi:hypothetical protein